MVDFPASYVSLPRGTNKNQVSGDTFVLVGPDSKNIYAMPDTNNKSFFSK